MAYSEMKVRKPERYSNMQQSWKNEYKKRMNDPVKKAQMLANNRKYKERKKAERLLAMSQTETNNTAVAADATIETKKRKRDDEPPSIFSPMMGDIIESPDITDVSLSPTDDRKLRAVDYGGDHRPGLDAHPDKLQRAAEALVLLQSSPVKNVRAEVPTTLIEKKQFNNEPLKALSMVLNIQVGDLSGIFSLLRFHIPFVLQLAGHQELAVTGGAAKEAVFTRGIYLFSHGTFDSFGLIRGLVEQSGAKIADWSFVQIYGVIRSVLQGWNNHPDVVTDRVNALVEFQQKKQILSYVNGTGPIDGMSLLEVDSDMLELFPVMDLDEVYATIGRVCRWEHHPGLLAFRSKGWDKWNRYLKYHHSIPIHLLPIERITDSEWEQIPTAQASDSEAEFSWDCKSEPPPPVVDSDEESFPSTKFSPKAIKKDPPPPLVINSDVESSPPRKQRRYLKLKKSPAKQFHSLFSGENRFVTQNLPFRQPANKHQLVVKAQDLPPIGDNKKLPYLPSWKEIPPQWRIAAQMGIAAPEDVRKYPLPSGFYTRFFNKWEEKGETVTSLQSESDGIFKCITSGALYRCPGPGCAAPTTVTRQSATYCHLVFCPKARYKGQSVFAISYSSFMAAQKRKSFDVTKSQKKITSFTRKANDKPPASTEELFSVGQRVHILYWDRLYWWPGVINKSFVRNGTRFYSCSYDDGDTKDLEITKKTSHQIRPLMGDHPIPAESNSDTSSDDGSYCSSHLVTQEKEYIVAKSDSITTKSSFQDGDSFDDFEKYLRIPEPPLVQVLHPTTTSAEYVAVENVRKSLLVINAQIAYGGTVFSLREMRRDPYSQEVFCVLIGSSNRHVVVSQAQLFIQLQANALQLVKPARKISSGNWNRAFYINTPEEDNRRFPPLRSRHVDPKHVSKTALVSQFLQRCHDDDYCSRERNCFREIGVMVDRYLLFSPKQSLPPRYYWANWRKDKSSKFQMAIILIFSHQQPDAILKKTVMALWEIRAPDGSCFDNVVTFLKFPRFFYEVMTGERENLKPMLNMNQQKARQVCTVAKQLFVYVLLCKPTNFGSFQKYLRDLFCRDKLSIRSWFVTRNLEENLETVMTAVPESIIMGRVEELCDPFPVELDNQFLNWLHGMGPKMVCLMEAECYGHCSAPPLDIHCFTFGVSFGTCSPILSTRDAVECLAEIYEPPDYLMLNEIPGMIAQLLSTRQHQSLVELLMATALDFGRTADMRAFLSCYPEQKLDIPMSVPESTELLPPGTTFPGTLCTVSQLVSEPHCDPYVICFVKASAVFSRGRREPADRFVRAQMNLSQLRDNFPNKVVNNANPNKALIEYFGQKILKPGTHPAGKITIMSTTQELTISMRPEFADVAQEANKRGIKKTLPTCLTDLKMNVLLVGFISYTDPRTVVVEFLDGVEANAHKPSSNLKLFSTVRCILLEAPTRKSKAVVRIVKVHK